MSPQLGPHLPRIRLPVRIDIVKHIKEVDGKSTAPHAVIVAPGECRVSIYPNLPDDWPEDSSKVCRMS